MASACEVGVGVDIDVAENGSGTVEVGVSLDRAAADALGDLATRLDLADLALAGWDVTGPTREADNLLWVRASKRFGSAEELPSILAEIAGPEVFGGFQLRRRAEFAEQTWEVAGRVDPAAALPELFDTLAFNEGLGERVRGAVGDYGGDIPLYGLTISLNIDLPGDLRSGGGNFTWTALTADSSADRATAVRMTAHKENTTAKTLRLVGLAAAALFVLAMLLNVLGWWYIRRLRKRRAGALMAKADSEQIPAVATGTGDDGAAITTGAAGPLGSVDTGVDWTAPPEDAAGTAVVGDDVDWANLTTAEYDDLSGDFEDLSGDFEDLPTRPATPPGSPSDFEDLSGDFEDLPTRPATPPGSPSDFEDLSGDFEDLPGEIEDLSGDFEDLPGVPEDEDLAPTGTAASTADWTASLEESPTAGHETDAVTATAGEPAPEAAVEAEPPKEPEAADEPEEPAGRPAGGEPDADGTPNEDEPGEIEELPPEPEPETDDAGEPDAHEPGADEPDAHEPGADEPDAHEPGADEPDAHEPGADEPDAGEPGADEPDAAAVPAPASTSDSPGPTATSRVLRLVVIGGWGVLFQPADPVGELLIPFVRQAGATASHAEIRELYRLATLGRLTPDQLWASCGLTGEPTWTHGPYTGRMSVSAGAAEFVRSLLRRRIGVACVTNDVSEWSWRLRAWTGFEALSPWVVSSDIGIRKPDPGVFEMLRRVSEIPFASCLVIDNDVRTLDAARSLGMSTGLFGVPPAEASPAGITHRAVGDFTDLLRRT